MARKPRELPPPPQDKLDAIRDAVRRDRDLTLEIASLEEMVKARKADRERMEHEVLPDLFSQAGMLGYTLAAEGNMPAYEAKAKPYYYANIAAEWAEERRQAAFDWIADPRGGAAPDMIKTQIVIELGRGERKLAEKVEAGLRKAKVPFVTKLSVPWNTLTAFVKEQVEVKKVIPPLDVLGATVGRVVTIKPEKKD